MTCPYCSENIKNNLKLEKSQNSISGTNIHTFTAIAVSCGKCGKFINLIPDPSITENGINKILDHLRIK